VANVAAWRSGDRREVLQRIERGGVAGALDTRRTTAHMTRKKQILREESVPQPQLPRDPMVNDSDPAERIGRVGRPAGERPR
jgi:hypothetical protein